jgi:hypothetical protein
MWCKASSASFAALVVGWLWAFSQAAGAAVVISGEDITGNAPEVPVATPASTSGHFIQSQIGNLPVPGAPSDAIGARSRYEGSNLENTAAFSVLGANNGAGFTGTANL